MTWKVTFCDEFELEFEALNEVVQDELLAQLKLLARFGPSRQPAAVLQAVNQGCG
jgi:hypothetical protein